ncbi:hypothetical protein TrST_g8540 [Triparma strigata]|uniref:Tubulin--tyrosine ligase-like protein 9 n=1 Tax=Triparma strigata TaxID=1606541 RepID=A0A9W7B3V6_9STRA|nr:hypothetical protein TrST_g8540 [Triparma strigata]
MPKHLGSSGPIHRPKGEGRASGPVKFRTSFSNTIYDVLCAKGWEETDSEHDWDVHWAEREWVFEVFDQMHLEPHQRLNHFRNAKEICRKDLLIKNLKKRKRQLEKEGSYEEATQYDFFPVTFNLPREYALFVEEFKRQGGLWIMKPIGSAQGKGIFLFSKLSEISEWRTDYRYRPGNNKQEKEADAYVVQRYINNPYLVGGKKFDLRLYVVVTSFSPLNVWIYRTGFARFTNTRYNDDVSDITNSFMHLTNVAIQKTADDYDKRTGGKWDLRRLKLHMISQFGAETTDAVFWEMQMIIIRSLLSVSSVMINDKHCFELYGYDIMIDDTLKPWLIEVNASPSLSASTQEDYVMKCEMLNDVLDIVDVEGKLKGDEEHVGGFDLVYENGFVDMDPKHRGWSSYLGSGIDRGPKKNGKGRRQQQQQAQPPENGGGGGEMGEKPRLAALDQYSKFLQTAAKGLK